MIMFFRGEMSERISAARTVTEHNADLTLCEIRVKETRKLNKNALLAQLDRASVYGTEG